MVRTIVFVFGLFLSISAAKAQMFSEFERAALIFTIAVANPSSAPRSIVQVGVRSRAHGTFNCLSGAHGLISLADYPVAFHVSKPETMIDADPILALPPKEIATFTISLYPNATGSCGYWSSIVSAVVKFDDGNTLETPSEMIDARQVESVRVRSPKREEVLGLAAHRSPMLRLQGIEKLPAVNVDTITAESVLRARYSDPVPDVREAAYAQSAAMKLTGLVPDLIARFDVVPKPKAGDRDSYSGELLSLCKAAAALHALDATDKVLAVLTDQQFGYAILLDNVLDQLRSPNTIAKLIKLLKENRGWAAAKEDSVRNDGPELATRYNVMLKSLISYQDLNSIPEIRSILDDPENNHTSARVLRKLVDISKSDRVTQSPFVMAFRDYALLHVKDPWGDDRVNLREAALVLAVRTSASQADQEELLRAAFEDQSVYVRLAAAKETAALKLDALSQDVGRVSASAPDSLKVYFCEAARELGTKCK